MAGFKQACCAAVAAIVVACVPVARANAAVHGYGHLHSWGLGRGLVGAVVGLATLPIAIVSAALSAGEPDAPYQSPAYAGSPGGYAPPPYYPRAPVYVPAPRTYYAPPQAYYPRAPVYASAPRAYYTPRPNYAPRSSSPAPQRYYGGPGRPGGYAYPRR